MGVGGGRRMGAALSTQRQHHSWRRASSHDRA